MRSGAGGAHPMYIFGFHLSWSSTLGSVACSEAPCAALASAVSPTASKNLAMVVWGEKPFVLAKNMFVLYYKRQHFVPRFYLDGFPRGGLVAVFDGETGEVRLQQPKNTTVIGHFYTMQDAQGRRRFELEALLSEYESKAKPCIGKLSAGGELKADERSDLAIFLTFAAMRTPDMVNSVQAMNGQMVKAIAKRLFADEEEVYARLRADPEHKDASDEELRERGGLMVHMAQNDGLEVNTNEK